MRKVSIALRRLGASEFPNLTRAEMRALKRESDPWSDDLEHFLKDMQEIDQDLPATDGVFDSHSGANGNQHPAHESVPDRFEGDISNQVVASSEPAVPAESTIEGVHPPPLDESGQVTLYSRREAQDGFSVTFKLRKNGNKPNAGKLTVYSHSSETQLSGLGDSVESGFSVSVPAASFIRLGSDRLSSGWQHLTLKGPGAPEAEPSDEEALPFLPVPDEVPGSLWAVPVELFAKTQNGLALTNASDEPVVVQLYLLDRQGNRLAGTLDPKLNPLSPQQQVLKPIDRFFPELLGLAEFYGTVVVRVEREGHVWAMGVIGNNSENLTIRRALNMNVDLEGLKAKMARELETILAREAALLEQMSHLDAVLNLASGNGNSVRPTEGGGFVQSLLEDSGGEFSEATGS